MRAVSLVAYSNESPFHVPQLFKKDTGPQTIHITNALLLTKCEVQQRMYTTITNCTDYHINNDLQEYMCNKPTTKTHIK